MRRTIGNEGIFGKHGEYFPQRFEGRLKFFSVLFILLEKVKLSNSTSKNAFTRIRETHFIF